LTEPRRISRVQLPQAGCGRPAGKLESPERGSIMNRTILGALVVVLAVIAGVLAYQAYERDRNSLQIEVGPQGVKVDPPG